MSYQHVQHGKLLGPVAGFVIIATVGALAAARSVPWVYLILLPLAFVLAAVTVANRLTVTVAGSGIIAEFGWGWPKRVIRTHDVVSAGKVRNRWWYGWGIRWVPHGTMYNVWGLDAVELDLRNGRVFRIGTDEPDALLQAIGARIVARPG